MSKLELSKVGKVDPFKNIFFYKKTGLLNRHSALSKNEFQVTGKW